MVKNHHGFSKYSLGRCRRLGLSRVWTGLLCRTTCSSSSEVEKLADNCVSTNLVQIFLTRDENSPSLRPSVPGPSVRPSARPQHQDDIFLGDRSSILSQDLLHCVFFAHCPLLLLLLPAISCAAGDVKMAPWTSRPPPQKVQGR
jgi:hypothetical protein